MAEENKEVKKTNVELKAENRGTMTAMNSQKDPFFGKSLNQETLKTMAPEGAKEGVNVDTLKTMAPVEVTKDENKGTVKAVEGEESK